ncbi:ABC transporter substrate-binding protein [Streptomyces sp. NPDC052107]|uniref:ABC transporter substrate-binding protein n=1 Tax=Streptomyces sp. NPDC052107 TaxID=3155632 RepID=UPI0034208E09
MVTWAGRRAATWTALAAAAMTAATACGSTTTSGTGGSTTKPTLVLYSAMGYDQPVADAFQKATGIPTKVVDDSTGPLLAKVAAEKANPQWGLLWADGAEWAAALDEQGQLLKGFTPSVAFNAAGQAALPKNKSYTPSGVTMAGTVVYDTTKTPKPPTSWQDLLTPAWKGKVGMNNPAVSGPTYPFVAGMMNKLGGESQGKDYYTKLKANGLHVFQTNGDTLHALATGQIDIALIQSSAGLGAAKKVNDPHLKTAFVNGVTLLPGVMAIDAKAPAAVQAEAKKFEEFVLSPAGQQAAKNGNPTGDSLFWPVVQGVSPLPAVPPLSSVKYQTVDPTIWGPKEAEINSWFTANIAK